MTEYVDGYYKENFSKGTYKVLVDLALAAGRSELEIIKAIREVGSATSPEKKLVMDERTAVIQFAKEYIEDLKSEGELHGDKWEYLDRKGTACTAEFIVNPEKFTVVCLLSGYYTKKIKSRGIAKCSPIDHFDENIGKAIALARALGKDVPDEFLDAPQPRKRK